MIRKVVAGGWWLVVGIRRKQATDRIQGRCASEGEALTRRASEGRAEFATEITEGTEIGNYDSQDFENISSSVASVCSVAQSSPRIPARSASEGRTDFATEITEGTEIGNYDSQDFENISSSVASVASVCSVAPSFPRIPARSASEGRAEFASEITEGTQIGNYDSQDFENISSSVASVCSVAQSSPRLRVGLVGRRRGISLLEVLISIGVLAVGLLSVAALIPAGRHEIAQGARLDYASMIGRAAFRDLQVRAFLNPGDATGNSSWQTVGTPPKMVWQPAGPGTPSAPFVYPAGGSKTNQVAVVMDPLGVFAIQAAGGTDTKFPYNAPATGLFLTRVAPINVTASGAREFMDTIFRSSVDLTITANTVNGDLPPWQFWFKDGAVPPKPLRRASEGNYSWLATIVSEPSTGALTGKVTVSVAVIHKRDLSAADLGEAVAGVVVTPGGGGGIGGGEARLMGISKAVRPGQWIMLAGQKSGSEPFTDKDTSLLQNGTEPYIDENGNGQWDQTLIRQYFRWYRVVAAQALTSSVQDVTLAGTDWDNNMALTQAFIIDNVVAVYEKNLPLEFEN